MAIITCMQALLVACLIYNRLEKVRNSSIHSEEKVLVLPYAVAQNIPLSYIHKASEYDRCFSSFFFSLCSLSTKYVKGQSPTANAKGLVWFLSSTALLLSVSCLRFCIFSLSLPSSSLRPSRS